MGQVESIFTQLPRKKEWRSFYVNDLPMLNIDIEIQEISMDNKLNKAQTKSLSNLKKNAPEAFKDIVKNIDDDGVINMGVDDDGETITLQDTSAKEIKFEGFTSDVLATKNTGDEESYTPIDYLESARVVMNGICLDPASNQMAQINVKANNYYTVDDDGLTKEWGGKVWMNPPYTALVINKFIDKLIHHFKEDHITDAIVLTNNNTDTSWFHSAAKSSNAICFTSGRINFLKRDGSTSSPTNGQSFFYFGSDSELFKKEFSQYGLVMVKA
jgi:hypothetical protein